MPYAIAPMLASTATYPGASWLREWKWDGFRCFMTVAPNGTTKPTSRNGNDLTSAFPELAAVFADALTGRAAVLDGVPHQLYGWPFGWLAKATSNGSTTSSYSVAEIAGCHEAFSVSSSSRRRSLSVRSATDDRAWLPYV
ncbi:hypothetical protein GKO32_24715 [Amycolatopsis sp. RM579]|uniref:ATP-dependent DNA ligase family profile domain-containing protein n=1 Tax=Amycolatopsis pithecellobii TaxID=664692 RepID=A0A6N7Z8V1_9PSEU|nr:hypothetical protein [Amycolatopsis pithecellobii]